MPNLQGNLCASAASLVNLPFALALASAAEQLHIPPLYLLKRADRYAMSVQKPFPKHEDDRPAITGEAPSDVAKRRQAAAEDAPRSGPNSIPKQTGTAWWLPTAQSEADSALRRGSALSLQASNVSQSYIASHAFAHAAPHQCLRFRVTALIRRAAALSRIHLADSHRQASWHRQLAYDRWVLTYSILHAVPTGHLFAWHFTAAPSVSDSLCCYPAMAC